jgi:hypothetical protein
VSFKDCKDANEYFCKYRDDILDVIEKLWGGIQP